MRLLFIICAILACGPNTEDTMGLNINFEGVYRGPNRHSQVPPGAAERAENIVSYNKGEAATTEGMETLPGTYTTSPERFSSGVAYDGYVIERSSTGALYRRVPGTSLTAITTGVDPPSGVARVPFAEAGVEGGDLYLATDTGVMVMDAGTASPATVGAAAPFAPLYSLGASGGVFDLEPDESVAYRATFARDDADGVQREGAPSGRIVVVNTNDPVAASGTVTLAGGAGNTTVTINGTAVGPVAFTVSDTQSAAAVVTAINASAVASIVTATSLGTTITITADVAGASGNLITLSASRTAGTATASGATLSGGDDSLRSLTISHLLPSTVVAGDRLLTYRTGVAAGGVNPGDIMYIADEHEITSAEVTAGLVTLVDNTPDELRGKPLYTNGTQGGILRQNERPPLAKVLCGFDDYMMCMNVQGPERFSFRLLAVPDDFDFFTIAGETYMAALSDDYPNGAFVVETSGTVSENIATTAQRLVRAINSKTANTSVYAYYVSGDSDPPGMIMLEGRTVTTAAYTVVASANGTRYEPQLTTAQSSLATTEPSGIWVSKRGEHYAFPPLRSSTATYRFRVGTRGKPILAAAAIRDGVVVFTSGEGVFIVRRVGNELWRSDQINGTVQLLAPSSVAVVDNQVLALTNRGIVSVDAGGVEEIDLPIKEAITGTGGLLSLSPSVLSARTFGVGDDARQRYTLYHPESNSDTASTHAWVYNGTTGTWTERTDDATGGFVDPDTGLLYLGSATSPTLCRERTGTAAQIFKRPDNTAIPYRLEYTVMDEGDPGASKQYTELRLLLKDAATGTCTFNCTNDLGGTESTTATATSEPFFRAWVPDGTQWTSRLKVDIQRSVLSAPFTVVGMKTLLAGMEDGSFTR